MSVRGASIILAAMSMSLLGPGGASGAVGGITQKPGTDGCISETGSAGACADGKALDGANAIAVSPDGANAYVGSFGSDAIGVFDRNPLTGALTQKAGVAGCVSETGTGGACADGSALDPNSVVVSPDGANVYAASFGASSVAIFDRNPLTGALTQKAGTAGCISETGSSGACTDGFALDGAIGITASADGKSVYVASVTSDAVTSFDRNPSTGALTQKAGAGGCVSETGTGGACSDGKALEGANAVAITPDGHGLYASARDSDAVVIFERNTSTGIVGELVGTNGCISETGTGGLCGDGVALVSPKDVGVSPDGISAYVVSDGSDAVAVFDRTNIGTLTQKAGTAGCISETGTGGACVDGTALGGANGVAVSPDGNNLFIAATTAGAVSVLSRSTATGTLFQFAGAFGCVSETGTAGACADGTALASSNAVAVSPDGAGVYSAGNSDAVAIFDRELPPETTIDSGPSGLTNDDTPTFGFSSTDAGSSFACKVDGDDEDRFKVCSGPGGAHTADALADGPHLFQVRATDPADNTDKTPASRTFTVDTTAPETTITRKPKRKLKTKKPKARVAVSFSSEAGASFECRLDQAEFTPCSSPFSATAKSKGGKGKKHSIEVRATDAAGNVEGAPPSVEFKLVRKLKD